MHTRIRSILLMTSFLGYGAAIAALPIHGLAQAAPGATALSATLTPQADVHVLTNKGVGLLQLLKEREKGDPYNIATLLQQAGCVK